MPRREDLREQALKDLQHYEVLMLDGHFDFGNGYHGPVYLHPHKLFRYPSTIWRFAQDLLDIMPTSILQDTVSPLILVSVKKDSSFLTMRSTTN